MDVKIASQGLEVWWGGRRRCGRRANPLAPCYRLCAGLIHNACTPGDPPHGTAKKHNQPNKHPRNVHQKRNSGQREVMLTVPNYGLPYSKRNRERTIGYYTVNDTRLAKKKDTAHKGTRIWFDTPASQPTIHDDMFSFKGPITDKTPSGHSATVGRLWTILMNHGNVPDIVPPTTKANCQMIYLDAFPDRGNDIKIEFNMLRNGRYHRYWWNPTINHRSPMELAMGTFRRNVRLAARTPSAYFPAVIIGICIFSY